MSVGIYDCVGPSTFPLGKYFIHGIFFSLVMLGFLPFAFLVDWIVRYDPRPPTFEPLMALFAIVYIFLGLFIILGAVNSTILYFSTILYSSTPLLLPI